VSSNPKVHSAKVHNIGARPKALDEAVLAELRRWGGPAEMSAFEALMWQCEADPRLRSTTTSVLILDREPPWERFHADHRWLAGAVPRFRQRVVVPAFGVGQPTWTEDPDFELDYHVRRQRLPAPGTERQLLDAAAILAMTPFDRAKPPWEATLIEGLEGGRAAYVLKLHHAVSDGLGIMQLLSRVFTRDRDEVVRPKPQVRDKGRVRPATPVGLGLKALAGATAAFPRRVSDVTSFVVRHLSDLSNDPKALRETLEYLASAKRMLGNKPGAGSRLFARRSLTRRLDTIEVPLARLKAVSKAVEASINDTFLSAMMGGFRRYHEEMGVTVRDMPIGFPISLRSGNDPMGGNKFAGSQYDAPITEKDPVERIRHVQRFVKETRAEPALDAMIRLTPVLSRLPIAVVTRLMARFTESQDAQISNIPGIADTVYLAGAEVTQYWPFAPAPGCGMMITMLSHNGRCCIGINSDTAAVTEPELLVECLRAGLDEVLALADDGQRTAPAPADGRSSVRPFKTPAAKQAARSKTNPRAPAKRAARTLSKPKRNAP
jgi:WS/DGAT/MGAT family acyltransferase